MEQVYQALKQFRYEAKVRNVLPAQTDIQGKDGVTYKAMTTSDLMALENILSTFKGVHMVAEQDWSEILRWAWAKATFEAWVRAGTCGVLPTQELISMKVYEMAELIESATGNEHHRDNISTDIFNGKSGRRYRINFARRFGGLGLKSVLKDYEIELMVKAGVEPKISEQFIIDTIQLETYDDLKVYISDLEMGLRKEVCKIFQDEVGQKALQIEEIREQKRIQNQKVPPIQHDLSNMRSESNLDILQQQQQFEEEKVPRSGRTHIISDEMDEQLYEDLNRIAEQSVEKYDDDDMETDKKSSPHQPVTVAQLMEKANSNQQTTQINTMLNQSPVQQFQEGNEEERIRGENRRTQQEQNDWASFQMDRRPPPRNNQNQQAYLNQYYTSIPNNNQNRNISQRNVIYQKKDGQAAVLGLEDEKYEYSEIDRVCAEKSALENQFFEVLWPQMMVLDQAQKIQEYFGSEGKLICKMAYIFHWEYLDQLLEFLPKQQIEFIWWLVVLLQSINMQGTKPNQKLHEAINEEVKRTKYLTDTVRPATLLAKNKYDILALKKRRDIEMKSFLVKDFVSRMDLKYNAEGDVILTDSDMRAMNDYNKKSNAQRREKKKIEFQNKVLSRQVEPDSWQDDTIITKRPTSGVGNLDYYTRKQSTKEDMNMTARGSRLSTTWWHSRMSENDKKTNFLNHTVHKKVMKQTNWNGGKYLPKHVYKIGQHFVETKFESEIIRSISKMALGEVIRNDKGEDILKVWSLHEVEAEIMKYTNLCLYFCHGICIHPECGHAHPPDFKSILYHYRIAIRDINNYNLDAKNRKTEASAQVERWYLQLRDIFKYHTGTVVQDYNKAIILGLMDTRRDYPRLIRQFILGSISKEDLALKYACLKMHYMMNKDEKARRELEVLKNASEALRDQDKSKEWWKVQLQKPNLVFNNKLRDYYANKALQTKSIITKAQMHSNTSLNYCNKYWIEGEWHILYDGNDSTKSLEFDDTSIYQIESEGLSIVWNVNGSRHQMVGKDNDMKVKDAYYRQKIDYATSKVLSSQVERQLIDPSKVKVVRCREEENILLQQIDSDPIIDQEDKENLWTNGAWSFVQILSSKDIDCEGLRDIQYKGSLESMQAIAVKMENFVEEKRDIMKMLRAVRESKDEEEEKRQQEVNDIIRKAERQNEENDEEDAEYDVDTEDFDAIHPHEKEVWEQYLTLNIEERVDFSQTAEKANKWAQKFLYVADIQLNVDKDGKIELTGDRSAINIKILNKCKDYVNEKSGLKTVVINFANAIVEYEFNERSKTSSYLQIMEDKATESAQIFLNRKNKKAIREKIMKVQKTQLMQNKLRLGARIKNVNGQAPLYKFEKEYEDVIAAKGGINTPNKIRFRKQKPPQLNQANGLAQ